MPLSIPTLDLPKAELEEFAAAVIDSFNNPYIDHALLAISLNSTAKWKARVMPSVIEYCSRTGKLPKALAFSFAAYVAFYTSGIEKGDGCLIGKRGDNTYEIKDDQWALDFYYAHKDDDNAALAKAVVNNEQMWGDALAKLPGFEAAVAAALDRIDAVGMYQAMKECL